MYNEECSGCGKLNIECECFNESKQVKEDGNKVKNPKSTHYELYPGVEAIDVIKKMLTPEEYRGFLKGNILKYQLRLGKKDGIEKEIEKIQDYTREIKDI